MALVGILYLLALLPVLNCDQFDGYSGNPAVPVFKESKQQVTTGADESEWRHQLELTLKEMERNQDYMLGQVKKLNSKIEQQEDKIKEQDNNDKVKKQDNTIKELGEKIREQDDRIKKQDDRIKKQDDKIREQDDTIKEQNDKIMKQDDRINEQNEKIKKLQKITWDQRDSTEINWHADNRSTDIFKNRQTQSDDPDALEPVISHVTSQVTQINAEIEALKNTDRQQQQDLHNAIAQQNQARGTTYVRWGHSGCPNASELIYSGDVGGSRYSYSGAAVDYLCLPHNPVFDGHPIPSVFSGNNLQELHGSEYEARSETIHNLLPVCALCRTPRASSIMVPATNTCPPGWTLDYHGYLMAGSINHVAASEFICVDSSEGYQEGTESDNGDKLLYYTVTRCGSLPCPPYVNNKIVSCAVCSK